METTLHKSELEQHSFR